MTDKVFYEELYPKEFLERQEMCPVAYLPLGTLEWHGPHLPLGTDGLEGRYLFERIAKEVGGIVLPMIFLGMDRYYKDHIRELYGMDMYLEGVNIPREYPMQQQPGSAYWVPDETYDLIIESIVKQLARAGFKVIIGIGHGPSTSGFQRLAGILGPKYGVRMFTPDQGLEAEEKKMRLIQDHAGESETSAMMYFRPDLVHMELLPEDLQDFAPGMGGLDPRVHASPEMARQRVDFLVAHVGRLVEEALHDNADA